MGLNCGCPVGTAITDVTINDCPSQVGQIQKIIFQRKYSTGTTLNTIADPTLEASWIGVDTVLDATDGEKGVVSPFINEPTTEAGAIRQYGGGNATVDGIPRTLGSEHTTFECKLLDYGQATVQEMKDLMCESLAVWFINENGKIIGKDDGAASPSTYYPIPIHSLFIGDKQFGGYEESDSNMISFSMSPNWSDDLAIITPADFTALELAPTP